MQVVLENELFQSSLLPVSEGSSALLCWFSVTGLDQYSRSNTHCNAIMVHHKFVERDLVFVLVPNKAQ